MRRPARAACAARARVAVARGQVGAAVRAHAAARRLLRAARGQSRSRGASAAWTSSRARCARRPRDRRSVQSSSIIYPASIYALRHRWITTLTSSARSLVALGDRIRDATRTRPAMSGALPAALVALHEWAGGRPIETLAGGLRLSTRGPCASSTAWRPTGLAPRARDPADGRSVLVASRRRARRWRGACSRRARRRSRRRSASLGARASARALARARGAGARELHRRPPARPGDLPALRRARLRARRGPLPGHAGGRPGEARRAGAADRAGSIPSPPPQSGGGRTPSPSSSQTSASRS